MAKGNQNKRASKAIHDEAMIIARSLQIPGQTKEETKTIAQGIQKGLEHYKKQQSAKEREVDKQLKKIKRSNKSNDQDEEVLAAQVHYKQHWLPWLLLSLSWLVIVGYVAIS